MVVIYSLIYSLISPNKDRIQSFSSISLGFLISSKKDGIQSVSSISLGFLISVKKDEIQSLSSISLGFLISPLWWLSILSFISMLLFSLTCFSFSQKFPFIPRIRGKLLHKEINAHYIFARVLQFQKTFE